MEYRKICNVCHNIWCYTDDDLKENNKNATIGALASIGSLASAIGGTRYDMYEMNKVSNNATNKIKDFNKCPFCNSTDISDLSEEEFKLINKKKSLGNSATTINSNASVDALIKRIELFMEDDEWDDADLYCNQALDVEPDNGYLWLLKLLINVKWKYIDNKIVFNNSIKPLNDCKYYDKVQRFSKDDNELKSKIKYIDDEISEYFYKKAKDILKQAQTRDDYEKAFLNLMKLDNYKDSEELVIECEKKIDEIKDLNLQQIAEEKINSKNIMDLLEAKKIYKENKEWKDSDIVLKEIENKIKEINDNKEKCKNRIKKLVIIAIVMVLLIAIIVAVVTIASSIISKNKEYEEALKLFKAKKYEESIAILTTLDGFKDSKEILEQVKKEKAKIPISKAADFNDGNGFVGYYADFDGIPGIDGIIYVDLLNNKKATGKWRDDLDSFYIIPKDSVNASNVKDYVISDEAIIDKRFDNTARYIISPSSDSTGTEDRFYVMGLENLTDGTNETFNYWNYGYDTSNSDMKELYYSDTSQFWGGKTNTDIMITKLDVIEPGNDNMWKLVKTKRTEYPGWFVPSSGEWGAFANAFNISNNPIDKTYYSNFGLSAYYWTSSQRGKNMGAWLVNFGGEFVGSSFMDDHCYVRLSTTF